MDRFLTDGELVTLQTAFHKQQYEDVIDFDASVLAEIEGEDTPDIVAVKSLVQHAAGDTTSALHIAQELEENARRMPLCKSCVEKCSVQIEIMSVQTIKRSPGKSSRRLHKFPPDFMLVEMPCFVFEFRYSGGKTPLIIVVMLGMFAIASHLQTNRSRTNSEEMHLLEP
ncbi:hypothetical protein V8E54_000664 [Elaphomyces granulatus]